MVLLTSILLPLYLYPVPDAWDWVTNAITAHPSVDFNIIINPASGPGPVNTLPDASYIDAIAALNAFNNTNLLGYVDTGYMHRDTDSVVADVATYKFWSTYTTKDIQIHGIFFDDCVSTWNATTSAWVSTVAARTRDDGFTITLNPGTTADAPFFDLADDILMLENPYDAVQSLVKLDAIPQPHRANSSVIFHHFTGSTTDQSNFVREILSKGFRSLYVTSVEYASESALWMPFVAAVDDDVVGCGGL
ncbi:hypothetical protein DSL72_002018 [Monilinia vaccinii-corymbosi]|uniref:Spherulation-specific family 4 n=1 Tax=Monilinia vaccinii-corymbosi TaxID=61207 RepID=A0A8A3PBG1_9HELO|nr:hypothetical protein DSL72_002018 [Monilinia vaccinii-corymbosi]